MTTNAGTSLARLTVVSPKRRVDIALPESIIVAELLPGILRAAGDGAADDAQEHGGWVLRREDGTLIEATRTLAAQDIRDGELLYLGSRQADWPELDYDDVVDAIATNARGRNRGWTGSWTRRTALLVATTVLIGGLVAAILRAPSWFELGLAALGVALLLALAGTALSRALGDAVSGSALAGVGMLFAWTGGLVLLARSFSDIRPSHVLVACGALCVAAMIGYIGVAGETQYFVAGVVIAVLGALTAAAARIWDLSAGDAAAVATALALVFAPAFPILAIRLGKLPVPALPTTTEELLADPPHPPLHRVHATVKRSDEILHGLYLGSAAVLCYAEIALALSGKASALVLLGIVAVLSLLRARLLPAVAHRVPTLVVGGLGLVLLVIGTVVRLTRADLTIAAVAVVVVVAALVAAAGLYFQDHRPTPYLSRLADMLDVVLMLLVVPTVCLVVGLFGYFRGLFG